MNIDIRTLVIVVGITNVLQIIAIFLQYLINKTYRGIGWWVLGFASGAIGFVLLLLRDHISIELISIIAANGLLILGGIFQYIGIMRFLDKKENRWIVISILTVFILSFFYFTYVKPDFTARSLFFSAIATTISFLTAQGLFANKTRSITASANFNTAVLLAQGCFFAFRAVVMLTAAPVNSIFTSTLAQTTTFLESFIEGILWTFGLIIMVNQRLNAEMSEAKEHFELIFNTGPDAALITRLHDGHFMDINEGFTALTGFTREDIIGKSTLSINIWKNSADHQKVIKELSEKGFCENFEAVFQRKDGGETSGIISAKIITLQGTPHIISVTRDITERKRAEEVLHTSEERYRLLVENANEVIAVAQDGMLKFVNRMAIDLTGYSEQDLTSRPFPEFVHPDDRGMVVEHYLKRLKGDVSQSRYDFRLMARDGSIKWLEIGAVLIDWEGKPATLNFFSDITERKRTEEALRDSLTEKEVLLREVHHRVKNNLSAIIGLITMGQTEVKDAATATLMKELESRIRAMLFIHEGLYRSENLARIAFQGYLETLLSHLHSSFASQGAVRFSVAAAGVELGLDAAVPCGLIVNEWVTNAFKHAFPGDQPRPGEKECAITVSAEQNGGATTLTVADNGVGLPADLDWAATKTMGLRLVQMLGQHQLGGTIEVDRARGTRFTLTFNARK
jgi:PAS domain S-box-containing protein